MREAHPLSQIYFRLTQSSSVSALRGARAGIFDAVEALTDLLLVAGAEAVLGTTGVTGGAAVYGAAVSLTAASADVQEAGTLNIGELRYFIGMVGDRMGWCGKLEKEK